MENPGRFVSSRRVHEGGLVRLRGGKAILLTLLASPVFAQDPSNDGAKPATRLELRAVPGSSASLPDPDKEPGDSVVVDSEGTIICTSRGRSFSFPMTNRISPHVEVSYPPASGRIRYEYRVANGSDALKPIGIFTMSIAPPSDVVLPAPWIMLRNEKPGGSSEIGFLRMARDGDAAGTLSPGAVLGPIVFSSDLGPGLLEAKFYPEPEIGVRTGDGMTNGQFIDVASPWVRQQLAQLDTPSRHMLVTPVIGPVTSLTLDSIGQIHRELATAAQRPEFASLRARLQESPVPPDRAQLGSWIAQTLRSSGPGILTDFMNALNWRLQRLQ